MATQTIVAISQDLADPVPEERVSLNPARRSTRSYGPREQLVDAILQAADENQLFGLTRERIFSDTNVFTYEERVGRRGHFARAHLPFSDVLQAIRDTALSVGTRRAPRFLQEMNDRVLALTGGNVRFYREVPIGVTTRSRGGVGAIYSISQGESIVEIGSRRTGGRFNRGIRDVEVSQSVIARAISALEDPNNYAEVSALVGRHRIRVSWAGTTIGTPDGIITFYKQLSCVPLSIALRYSPCELVAWMRRKAGFNYGSRGYGQIPMFIERNGPSWIYRLFERVSANHPGVPINLDMEFKERDLLVISDLLSVCIMVCTLDQQAQFCRSLRGTAHDDASFRRMLHFRKATLVDSFLLFGREHLAKSPLTGAGRCNILILAISGFHESLLHVEPILSKRISEEMATFRLVRHRAVAVPSNEGFDGRFSDLSKAARLRLNDGFFPAFTYTEHKVVEPLRDFMKDQSRRLVIQNLDSWIDFVLLFERAITSVAFEVTQGSIADQGPMFLPYDQVVFSAAMWEDFSNYYDGLAKRPSLKDICGVLYESIDRHNAGHLVGISKARTSFSNGELRRFFRKSIESDDMLDVVSTNDVTDAWFSTNNLPRFLIHFHLRLADLDEVRCLGQMGKHLFEEQYKQGLEEINEKYEGEELEEMLALYKPENIAWKLSSCTLFESLLFSTGVGGKRRPMVNALYKVFFETPNPVLINSEFADPLLREPVSNSYCDNSRIKKDNVWYEVDMKNFYPSIAVGLWDSMLHKDAYGEGYCMGGVMAYYLVEEPGKDVPFMSHYIDFGEVFVDHNVFNTHWASLKAIYSRVFVEGSSWEKLCYSSRWISSGEVIHICEEAFLDYQSRNNCGGEGRAAIYARLQRILCCSGRFKYLHNEADREAYHSLMEYTIQKDNRVPVVREWEELFGEEFVKLRESFFFVDDDEGYYRHMGSKPRRYATFCKQFKGLFYEVFDELLSERTKQAHGYNESWHSIVKSAMVSFFGRRKFGTNGGFKVSRFSEVKRTRQDGENGTVPVLLEKQELCVCENSALFCCEIPKTNRVVCEYIGLRPCVAMNSLSPLRNCVLQRARLIMDRMLCFLPNGSPLVVIDSILMARDDLVHFTESVLKALGLPHSDMDVDECMGFDFRDDFRGNVFLESDELFSHRLKFKCVWREHEGENEHRIKMLPYVMSSQGPMSCANIFPKDSPWALRVIEEAYQVSPRSPLKTSQVYRSGEDFHVEYTTRSIEEALDREECVEVSGPPGTGKTYVMKELISKLAVGAGYEKRKAKMVICASMHSILSSYKELVADLEVEHPGVRQRVEARTIHSFLGVYKNVASAAWDPAKHYTSPLVRRNLEGVDLVIIDEYETLNRHMEQFIFYLWRVKGVSFIFIGDQEQTPPRDISFRVDGPIISYMVKNNRYKFDIFFRNQADEFKRGYEASRKDCSRLLEICEYRNEDDTLIGDLQDIAENWMFNDRASMASFENYKDMVYYTSYCLEHLLQRNMLLMFDDILPIVHMGCNVSRRMRLDAGCDMELETLNMAHLNLAREKQTYTMVTYNHFSTKHRNGPPSVDMLHGMMVYFIRGRQYISLSAFRSIFEGDTNRFEQLVPLTFLYSSKRKATSNKGTTVYTILHFGQCGKMVCCTDTEAAMYLWYPWAIYQDFCLGATIENTYIMVMRTLSPTLYGGTDYTRMSVKERLEFIDRIMGTNSYKSTLCRLMNVGVTRVKEISKCKVYDVKTETYKRWKFKIESCWSHVHMASLQRTNMALWTTVTLHQYDFAMGTLSKCDRVWEPASDTLLSDYTRTVCLPVLQEGTIEQGEDSLLQSSSPKRCRIN